MPGLDPGIRAFPNRCDKDVDGRIKPGHDEASVPALASCDHDNLSWRAALHFLCRII
jgi:hypothetical protein